MKEKRKRRRRYLMAEVRLKSMKGGPGTNSVAVNISRGGISVYTKKALKVRERVKVKVSVLVGGAMMVSEEIAGVIRWIQPIGKQYAAGIRFDNAIDKRDYPVLARCLEYAGCNR